MFLGKVVLKICSKFTGEHPCRTAISVEMFCKFFEIALRHGRSPINLPHIFRPPFYKNTSERLLLQSCYWAPKLCQAVGKKEKSIFHKKKKRKKKTKVDLRTCGTISTTLTTWIVGKKTLPYVGKNVRNICWFAPWFSKKRETDFWKVFQWESVSHCTKNGVFH